LRVSWSVLRCFFSIFRAYFWPDCGHFLGRRVRPTFLGIFFMWILRTCLKPWSFTICDRFTELGLGGGLFSFAETPIFQASSWNSFHLAIALEPKSILQVRQFCSWVSW
jgi:hypothetical protein